MVGTSGTSGTAGTGVTTGISCTAATYVALHGYVHGYS